LFGPTLLAVAGGLVKSVAKTGIKGGLMVYEKGKNSPRRPNLKCHRPIRPGLPKIDTS